MLGGLIGELIDEEMPTRQRCRGDIGAALAPFRGYIEKLRHRPVRSIENERRALHFAIEINARYISAQLGSWRTHTRATVAPDCMALVATRLSGSDITAVAASLASRQLPADTHAQPAGSVTPPLRCGVLGATGDTP